MRNIKKEAYCVDNEKTKERKDNEKKRKAERIWTNATMLCCFAMLCYAMYAMLKLLLAAIIRRCKTKTIKSVQAA